MERHGYAIKKDIEARAGEASQSGDALVIRPGTLYRAISRLVYAALIAEMDQPAGPDAGDERRPVCAFTIGWMWSFKRSASIP